MGSDVCDDNNACDIIHRHYRTHNVYTYALHVYDTRYEWFFCVYGIVTDGPYVCAAPATRDYDALVCFCGRAAVARGGPLPQCDANAIINKCYYSRIAAYIRAVFYWKLELLTTPKRNLVFLDTTVAVYQMRELSV